MPASEYHEVGRLRNFSGELGNDVGCRVGSFAWFSLGYEVKTTWRYRDVFAELLLRGSFTHAVGLGL
jgi:hypothetical protein